MLTCGYGDWEFPKFEVQERGWVVQSESATQSSSGVNLTLKAEEHNIPAPKSGGEASSPFLNLFVLLD